VTTDYETVEEARNVLLCREAWLADIELAHKQWKSSYVAVHASQAKIPPLPSRPVAPAPVAALPAVRLAPPPASKDPNAMDVDRGQRWSGRKCHKCGKEGHFIAQCPDWYAQVKAALLAELEKEAQKKGDSSGAPEAGFV
jgi:hypothetical protein